jgi:hypothetical protein
MCNRQLPVFARSRLPCLASLLTVHAACHPLGGSSFENTRDAGREQRTLAGIAPEIDALGSRDAAPSSVERCVPQPVRFSEIVYDPEGADGAGDSEFIELIAGPNAALWGYTVEIADGSSGRTLAAVTLLDEADADGLFVIGGSAVSAARAYFSAPLPNGYDLARIYGCDGAIVDELRWGSWPDGSGHGVASARALARCDSAQTGWSPATPSPGASNHGHFSAGPCAASAESDVSDTSDFSSLDSATDASSGTNADVVDPNDADVDACEPARYNGLLLNEVLADPIGTDTATTEFLEILVPAASTALTIGVALWDGASGAIVSQAELVLAPGPERLVTVGSDVPDALPLEFALQNGPDALLLLDCDDAIVDGVAWGSGSDTVTDALGVTDVGQLEPGSSASRCGPSGGLYAAVPSPGAPNSGFVDESECAAGCGTIEPAWILVNEVLFDPPGRDGAGELEFVELRGPPGAVIQGWSLLGIDGARDAVWLGPVRLEGNFDENGLLVVGGSSVAAALPLGGLLQNGPDAFALRRCGGAFGDAVAWGTWTRPSAGEGASAATPREGASLCRSEDSVDTADNARDFAACSSPTPGAPNRWE